MLPALSLIRWNLGMLALSSLVAGCQLPTYYQPSGYSSSVKRIHSNDTLRQSIEMPSAVIDNEPNGDPEPR